MLDTTTDGSLKEQNELRLKNSQEIWSILNTQKMSDLQQIIKMHDSIFQGIGKIFDKKKNEVFLVKYSMKPDVTPIAQKPRPVPYYLQDPLQKWLHECVTQEIFERVEPGEPVTWCYPPVVQPTPRYANFSKGTVEPHMVRAGVDLRIPNKYMERNRILQAPVVEDFTCKFHDCKVFSRMDLTQGCHHLILNPDSRAVATFSTPCGKMWPKRLIFGAKSSQDEAI